MIELAGQYWWEGLAVAIPASNCLDGDDLLWISLAVAITSLIVFVLLILLVVLVYKLRLSPSPQGDVNPKSVGPEASHHVKAGISQKQLGSGVTAPSAAPSGVFTVPFPLPPASTLNNTDKIVTSKKSSESDKPSSLVVQSSGSADLGSTSSPSPKPLGDVLMPQQQPSTGPAENTYSRRSSSAGIRHKPKKTDGGGGGQNRPKSSGLGLNDGGLGDRMARDEEDQLTGVEQIEDRLLGVDSDLVPHDKGAEYDTNDFIKKMVGPPQPHLA